MPANTTAASSHAAGAGGTKKPVVEPPTTLKLLVIGKSSHPAGEAALGLGTREEYCAGPGAGTGGETRARDAGKTHCSLSPPCASSVGKSSLLLRFTDETFLGPEETSATIGVDFKVKVIERNGKRWKLSIWDTAGQERFRTLTSSYYRGAQGVILVYDITARDTFNSLSSWIAELDTFAGTMGSSREVVRIIVGNKVDKEYLRKVSTAEGEAFAASLDPPWMFMECSAKLGGETIVGEEGVFSRVVDQIIQTPQLYTKPILPPSNRSGPPGTYPRGTVVLGDEGGVASWCAC